jgi:hypothetical protein
LALSAFSILCRVSGRVERLDAFHRSSAQSLTEKSWRSEGESKPLLYHAASGVVTMK